MAPSPLAATLPLPIFIQGKVRDVYDLGERLLMVASDRISAFDYVLATAVPGKGALLTQLSAFWFTKLASLIPNHLISADVSSYPAELQRYRTELEGRSMLVRKTEKIAIECVVRGFLAGSGWKEYQAHGTVCGISLPSGLRESDKLPEPIFTPATKEVDGKHDENIPFDRMAGLVGSTVAAELKRLSLGIYNAAAAHAESKGLILCDTKFEFGRLDHKIILIDEILTPDSSRFWDAAHYKAGQPQESFDKQFVRDYLERIHWNKQPPAPVLPEDVVSNTQAKYIEAYRRLTGSEFAF